MINWLTKNLSIAWQLALDHRRAIFINVARVVALLIVIVAVAAWMYFRNPNRVVYQPVEACNVLTENDAKELLGQRVIRHDDANNPVINNGMAISKCSYTDENLDQMKVYAIAVQSAVNDKGATQNQANFYTRQKSLKSAQTIKGLGDAAYYDTKLDQLDILNGRDWLILTGGIRGMSQSELRHDAMRLAKMVVPNDEKYQRDFHSNKTNTRPQSKGVSPQQQKAPKFQVESL